MTAGSFIHLACAYLLTAAAWAELGASFLGLLIPSLNLANLQLIWSFLGFFVLF